MALFDEPAVSAQKTTDENVQALKVWAIQNAEQLNYFYALYENLEQRISKLESEEK